MVVNIHRLHNKDCFFNVLIVFLIIYTRKNNRFPFLDILGYLKNTHKNPKFGRVRQVPIRELGWEFPGWDLSHFARFGIFMGILEIPKISKMGILYFFL